MTSAIPLQNVPMVDSSGKITLPWQRFLLSLGQGKQAVKVEVDGTSGEVGFLNFGAGFFGSLSGSNALLTSGVEIFTDAGQSLSNVSTLVLTGNFGISGSDEAVTISAPSGAVEVGAYGVIVNEAAEILNFSGNVQITGQGNQAYIMVGDPLFTSQGTSVGVAGTVNAGELLSFTEISNTEVQIDFTGIPSFLGTAALGSFTALDIGPGILAGIGTGSLAGTLSLSGTGLDLVEGTTTLTGILGLVAGSAISFSGTSGAFGTISASAAGGGVYAPLVNGDLPGPGIMADPLGQCIMVEL